MDTNKNSKKIIILGIILLIIAGIIVVLLKGFNVSLLFGKHETIEIKLDTDMDLKTMQQICEETFGNKEFVVKELEVFGDSAQISVNAITDEEKTNLINKINERFGTSKTVEDLNIMSVSNKRIRDVVTPYLVPMVISFVIIIVYMAIRFRKIEASPIIGKFLKNVILTEAVLISIVAIARIPVTELLINIFMMIPIAEAIYHLANAEKKLQLKNEE